jgi:hyperosmotically inducible periplasmic protein
MVKEGTMRRIATSVGVAIMALAVMTGCRSMTGQSLGTNVDNKTTTANVKARLVADRLQNLGWVDVDTNAGTVYLGGTARSQAQKQRAEEVAREVDGVKKVVNNIQVNPAAATSDQTTGGSQSMTSGNQSTASASASPGSAMRGYTATGEVVSVDRALGHVTIRSDQGQIMLNLPQNAVEDLRVGDRVEFGIHSSR